MVEVLPRRVRRADAGRQAAAAQGWLDRDRAIMETLTGIKRAGASIILSYWAAEAARRLS